MKTANSKKAKTNAVIVEGDTYERYEQSCRFKKTYKGPSIERILIRVLDVHGYGWDDTEKENPTVEQLLKEIEERNGDGCDYIARLTINGKAIFEGPDQSEDEEEEVD